MNKKPNRKFEKVEKPQPPKKVRLEVYDDGLYVGTIKTEFTVNDYLDEETLSDYLSERFPTRKKKYLTVKIV